MCHIMLISCIIRHLMNFIILKKRSCFNFKLFYLTKILCNLYIYEYSKIRLFLGKKQYKCIYQNLTGRCHLSQYTHLYKNIKNVCALIIDYELIQSLLRCRKI